MRNTLLVLILFVATWSVKGQEKTIQSPKAQQAIKKNDSTITVVRDTTLTTIAKDTLKVAQDSLPKTAQENAIQKATRKIEALAGKTTEEDKAKIEDYLIISVKNDTTHVDTTLTIQKDYKYNYLRKDNFGLMPFTNIGQTYNSLTYDVQNTNLLPSFGARARHFNYMEVEDIYYYNVPTPLTELLYKTAFEQGQLLDSFITVNTSPQFNFSIAYKGLRSLGQYQHILTSTGNFRATTNYRTKNNKYHMRAHVVTQDLMNQENGGLQEEDIENFESGSEEFLDRPVFDPNFENAENILEGKRFYLEHGYTLFDNTIQAKDSIKQLRKFNLGKLRINHTLNLEDKFYQYDQAAPSELFGAAFQNTNLRDRVTLEQFQNTLELNYENTILGDFAISASNTDYNYGYNRVIVLNGETIPNRLKGDIYAVEAAYKKQYKGFQLKGEGGVNIAGDFDGNYFKAQAAIHFSKNAYATAEISHSSKAPNFNTLLYQSTYQNFNWQNNFSNIETQQVALKLGYKKIVNLEVDYTTLSDYVYFGVVENPEASQQIEAFQNNETITYLRAKLENEITVGKFGLANTVLYQSVDDANNVFNVPEITTRNSLYFSSYLFKKAMFFQTGVTLNYFTKFYLNAYNPVLAEFYVQNDREFGEFPRIDAFLNAKIRQTRIFLKAEHLNSSFTGFDFFSAPNVPFRDFTIRFGLVWNFFL